MVERLRVEIEKMSVQYDGYDIRLTVSVGGTIWDRDDRGMETVLKRADIALSEAKGNGRNRVCFSFAKNGEA